MEINNLTEKRAADLFGNISWLVLRVFNLFGRNWAEPIELDLCFKLISDKGAEFLSTNPRFGKIQELNLSDNSISYRGGAPLGKDTNWELLQRLDLSNNVLGDKGTSDLDKNTSWVNFAGA